MGNSKNAVGRKKIKQGNFAEIKTKYFVRIPDKNYKNAIFRTGHEDTSIFGGIMLRITAGARKKGKPHMRCTDDIKSTRITGLSINDLKQLVQGRKEWRSLMNNIAKKRKRDNV